MRLNVCHCFYLICFCFLTACQFGIENAKLGYNDFSKELTKSDLNSIESDYSAHWLKTNLLLLPNFNSENTYHLVRSDTKQALELKAISNSDSMLRDFPHLENFKSFQVPLTNKYAKEWLKFFPFVLIKNNKNEIIKIAYTQTGFVLDDIYTRSANDADEVGDLGASVKNNAVTFKLWAPTAQMVKVLLFDKNKNPLPPISLSMQEDAQTGVWSAQANKNLELAYYQYQIKLYHYVTGQIETLVTTDPYSLSLSTNSKFSQVINLDDAYSKPAGWDGQEVPTVDNPEDNIFYEVHIRDFSSADPDLSKVSIKGKYKAFSEKSSAGIKHLKQLRSMGLNNIHLLPTFDIATAEEDKSQVIDLYDSLKKVCALAMQISICQNDFDESTRLIDILNSFDPASKKAQDLVTALKSFDNYNWGYDPYHYTVPEGSYALNPDGVSRIIEFREMVKALHEMGFRVIMDVVYNHTYQAGLEQKSVLDKIVPNYYHRLNPVTGAIEQSTCCDNTATERAMMAKLMTESLVVWSRDYKIDGFRFDLMGHQPKAAMLAARAAVRKIDADTYFYGEGWNFGEVADNQRFVQASQLKLAGTEIGTFSDRMRDAVRGCCFNSEGEDIRRNQGIGNGLGIIPNELSNESSDQEYKQRLDHLRLGLIGNLANYPIVDSSGHQVLGSEILYGTDSAAYALDPADTINYVSKHDNQTLWDNNQYRNAYELSTQERVRMHNQNLSFVLLAQGIPFIHMGSELLRSKSYLRDSYDYGDWFNRVDFTKQSNFYNIGLPPQEKDQKNWPLIKKVIRNNQGRDHVTSSDIKFSADVFNEFLKIRTNTTHFRLTSSVEVIQKIKFHNTGLDQQLGLIVMSISSSEQAQSIVVVFNFSSSSQTFLFENAQSYQLHHIQANGVDSVVKQSIADTKGFSVPGFTSAVFVEN